MRRCVLELPEKNRQLKSVEDRIAQQWTRLEQIEKQANSITGTLRNFKYNLDSMEYQVNRAINDLKKTIQNE